MRACFVPTPTQGSLLPLAYRLKGRVFGGSSASTVSLMLPMRRQDLRADARNLEVQDVGFNRLLILL